MERALDRIMTVVFWIGGAVSVIAVVTMFLFLAKESIPIFQDVSFGEMIFSAIWNPDGWDGEFYGILSLVWGTMYVTLLTLLFSIPLGIAIAVFVSEYSSERMQMIIKPVLEILAGIPSVVIGFIGITVLGPLLATIFHQYNGFSVLNGAILLTFMVLPTIVSLSEDALHAVPDSYRQASMAMGANKIETILFIILPAARSGIIAAVLLGMGRAIGETMAVLMACGNTPAAAISPLDPVRTLTATIAIEMGEVAYDTTHYYALFNLGLYLFIISFMVNIMANKVARRGIR